MCLWQLTSLFPRSFQESNEGLTAPCFHLKDIRSWCTITRLSSWDNFGCALRVFWQHDQPNHLLWVTPTNSSQSDTLHNNLYKEQNKDSFYSDFVLRSIFTILWLWTLITFACFVLNLFPPRTLRNWWVTESCGTFYPRSILTSISSIAGTWSASSEN